jgi:hypothetical protein
VPPTGSGVLIRLDERRVSRKGTAKSPEGVWFILLVAATLLTIVIWHAR